MCGSGTEAYTTVCCSCNILSGLRLVLEKRASAYVDLVESKAMGNGYRYRSMYSVLQ